MIAFISKRIVISLVLILAVMTFSFVLMHMAPGDPTAMYIRPEIAPKVVESIRHQFGLDQSLWQQYVRWIKECSQFEFGTSFTHLRPVRAILTEALRNTLQLTLIAFLFQMVIGILLGIYAAIKEHSWQDQAIQSGLLILYSIPGFWLALLAITLFSLKLGWLPSGQMQAINTSGGWHLWLNRIQHMILPVIILSMPFIAYTARFMRESVLRILKQDYIRTAFSYGLPKRRILGRYVLKNALMPQVTLIGLYLPFLFGGAVVIEHIFAWPGVGRITVNAIFSHDFPLILASNFIATVTVVVGNLISDMLYAVVDPRIRHQSHA
ncbi:ABC transporter permease [candidate division KSB1 bacterium]|nr:ABC transporter permease [candidate division KSB1 bacterium]